MGSSATRCGTPSGWTRHMKSGETPCAPCKAAKAEYDKRWRSAPAVARKNRVSARAQRLALRDLMHAHRDEYRRLYAAHKAAALAEPEVPRS